MIIIHVFEKLSLWIVFKHKEDIHNYYTQWVEHYDNKVRRKSIYMETSSWLLV